jgi:sortase (surface protein transpeptidase)
VDRLALSSSMAGRRNAPAGHLRQAGARDAAVVPSGASHADPSTAGIVPAIEVHSARLADRRVEAGPVPTRLRIPAVALNAPVVPIGVDEATGAMAVPIDVSIVGWYRFGASPGEGGSSLLVGHVDSRVQGEGVFFRLSQLQPGDGVIIEMGPGRVERFEVVARRSYGKDELPGRVFTRTGQPFLTLVTCGGSFDVSTRHYSDNVVVFAAPVAPSPATVDGMS